MFKLSQSIFIVLLIALSGCANKPSRPGILTWDYEREEVTDLRKLGDNIPIILGGLVLNQIDLTPSVLNLVILTALTQPIQGTIHSPAPTSATPAVTQWEISESNEGQITTDWKSIPGKKAGLLWWEKTYETEVRHIITIMRSYRDSSYANFSIVTKVRERPNSNYKWVPGDPELGRKSFEDIKNMLLGSVRKAIKSRRTTANED